MKVEDGALHRRSEQRCNSRARLERAGGRRAAVPAPTFRVAFDISGGRTLRAEPRPRASARKRHTCIGSANSRFATVWYAICSPAVVIRLTLSIIAAQGESWRLIDALRSLMVPTRRERGCLSCQLVLSSESSDPARISYSEEWSSEEDSARAGAVGAVLAPARGDGMRVGDSAAAIPAAKRRPRARLRQGSPCWLQAARPRRSGLRHA